MYISWKEFEEEVFLECERVSNSQGTEVLKNEYIVGRYSGVKRQIDVIVRQHNDGEDVNMCVVECKYYAKG
jgi:hypothetical protein